MNLNLNMLLAKLSPFALAFSLVAFASIGESAKAEPYVCFTSSLAESGLVHQASWTNPSCSALKTVTTGLDATSLILSATGVGLACTGIGIPATLWIEGSAIGIQFVSLMIGQLPCDDSVEEERIREMAEIVVCEELMRQGMTCSYLR